MAYQRPITGYYSRSASAPVTTPAPSGGIVETLFRDIIGLLAMIFGRTVIGSAATSTPGANAQPTPQAVVAPPPPPKPTISAHDAITQAIATETKLNPRDFKTGWYLATNPQWQQETINAEIVYGWNPNVTCGGPTPPGLTLQEASSAALGGTGAAVGILSHAGLISAGATSALGIATAGAGIVVGIILAIFQHHAAAVARDNRAECQLIPACNNSFQAIIQGVQNGTIKPSDAAAAMDVIPQQFLTIAGAAKNNSPYCNALCEYLIRVRAIVIYWKSQFQSME